MDIDDVPIKANMTHSEWKSIDPICMISMILPSLSKTMALWRWLGREKCFIRVSHSKVQEGWGWSQGMWGQGKTNTVHHVCLPSPADLRRVLERERCAVLAPGRFRSSPWKKLALPGTAGWEAEEAPSSIVARGCELGGRKHKIWAFKELDVDILPQPSQR